MGMSHSIKAILSFNNIYDLSNNTFCYFNKELDKMEKGQEKDNVIIDIFEEKYWRDRKLYIDYETKSQRIKNRRTREILSLKQKLNIANK